ncbi:MAG: pyridoxamine 5'-phosphate oxidase family protein [Bacteroidia bacterium]|nr:pyridoxamine 5'-phosphate oxidase family protein [Bacteroidia bacterium]
MGDFKDLTRQEAIEKIKDLATGTDICMFATSLTQLPLIVRPMSTMQVDEEGNLWFFSKKSSEKNREILADKRVQLFYASRNSSEYLSLYGEASISTDKNKAEEIWSPIVKAWFTEGINDPELTLIKVVPHDSYYWDTKHNRLISLIKIAAATVTGTTMDDGVEGKLKL